jgi:hypothetical protein
MHIADVPPTRTYNRVAPLWDELAVMLRSNPTEWVANAIQDMPSCHKKKRMAARILDAMRQRGLRVATRTDATHVYVRMVEELGGGQ